MSGVLGPSVDASLGVAPSDAPLPASSVDAPEPPFAPESPALPAPLVAVPVLAPLAAESPVAAPAPVLAPVGLPDPETVPLPEDEAPLVPLPVAAFGACPPPPQPQSANESVSALRHGPLRRRKTDWAAHRRRDRVRIDSPNAEICASAVEPTPR